jgi:transposase-like protein
MSLEPMTSGPTSSAERLGARMLNNGACVWEGRYRLMGSVRTETTSWHSGPLSVMLNLQITGLQEGYGLMNCPYCAATTIKERAKKTKLGYNTFFCTHCRCTFNERTGTPFNSLEFPTDIVLLAVVWRLRYKLSLRDIAEMFLSRGFVFSHEAIRGWETRFAPLITEHLRTKRRGQRGEILVCG